MKRLSAIAALLVAVALSGAVAVGCGGDDDDDDENGAGGGGTTELSIAYPTDSFASIYPFELADALGYFEEEGLRVTSEIADGSTGAVQQAIAGNTDAGLTAASAYLSAAAAGEDVRALYTTQYRNIFTIAVPADSGVDSLEDLEGSTVGVSDLSGGEVPLLRGLFREAGLSGGDYEFVAVGEGAQLTVNALDGGRIDAYSSNLYDVAAIRNAGLEMDAILPETAETFPGNAVVVTADTLEEKRDAFVGLLRAASKAIAYTQENPDAALETLAERFPEQFEERELAEANWDIVTDFLLPQPEEIADEPYGSPFMPGLQAYHDFLLEGDEEEGALPGPVDLDAVIDTSLLEEAADFDPAEVEEQAGGPNGG